MRGPCITGWQHSIVFVLLLGFTVLDSALGLKCLSCNRAMTIYECLASTITCSDRDETRYYMKELGPMNIKSCFLEEVTLPDLSVVYNAGCRSNQVCAIMALLSGKQPLTLDLSRERKDLVHCAQCCKTPANSTGIPCNGYLCNQAPSIPVDTCAFCDAISDPKLCHITQSCQDNEMCVIKQIFSGTKMVYELGCERKTMCDVMLRLYKKSHGIAIIGKREGIQLCAACCVGGNCNADDCFQLRKRQRCNDLFLCGS